MIIGYILGGLIIYFLYKFIVGFVLPVVRTTNAMKRKMEQMRQPYQSSDEKSDQRNNQRKESNHTHANVSGTAGADPSAKKGDIFGRFRQANSKPAKADYIEFEEVKEDPEMSHP